ncbi:UNVERIFIED_CONTAM: hypothetical protein Slati_3096100 [Sesamum latifolium]|uniref:Uncharacterized protein n=1 Tax=Sesamum latifolium TaxID=2727402 RepID=A0AAW2UUS1_9LAMI
MPSSRRHFATSDPLSGDFNCVKSPAEKQLGAASTWYELKDFVDCCLTLGLHDAPTTGYYYTWYSNNDSNPVWCKLDRVVLNNKSLEAGLHGGAHFNPPGCLSDHSPDHPDFIATIEYGWSLNVEGTPQFSLCKKLKVLKSIFKAINSLHFNHISIRAKEANLALQDEQLQLESNPRNAALRDSLGDLRKKVVFLAEVEIHFFYQKAIIYFLTMGDQNSKFFHDMVKRNAARNVILAVTKSDGSIITSNADIAQEFIASTPHSWRRSLRKSTDFARFSSRTLREHQLPGRKFVILRKSVDSVSDTFNPGIFPSLPELWNIHHKADTLWVKWINDVYLRGVSIWDWQPKKGDFSFLQRLADIRNKVVTTFSSSEAAIQRMAEWSNIKGLETSKAYEYFRPKLTKQPWKAAI